VVRILGAGVEAQRLVLVWRARSGGDIYCAAHAVKKVIDGAIRAESIRQSLNSTRMSEDHERI